MLRLYLIFLWDAVQVVAASVVAVLVAIAAFNKLGVPPAIVSMTWGPLALIGFGVLAHRYVGRNLGWILGLPQRKVSLAWFNFGMNLSLLALVIVASCTVIAATYVLFPDDPSRTVVAAITRIPSLSRPHGRTLAILVFFVTMMLFTCGNVMRQPDAAERTRQKGRMLLGILIIFMLIPVALGFASSLARPTSQPDAVSPLLVFVAGMAIVCISMPYGTAKSLGTSVRQRRVWMLVGAAIAFVEIVALVAVTVSDLKSADPSVRKEAAKLLGSFAGPTGQGADLADDRTAANPALNGEPRSAHAAPPGPFPPAPPGTLIELERTECLGTCPAYTVTLNELGEVTFEGRKFVTTNGSATGAASQREVARLVATVRAHGLFDLEDSYFCPVTDFPTVRVRVVLEGRTKKISHDLGCEMVRRTDPSASGPPPAWLTSFENRIDQVAGTERWIGMGRDAADRDATRL